MQSIAKEYLILFNAITDAGKILQELGEKLKFAQQCAEEAYIEKPETAGGNNFDGFTQPDERA